MNSAIQTFIIFLNFPLVALIIHYLSAYYTAFNLFLILLIAFPLHFILKEALGDINPGGTGRYIVLACLYVTFHRFAPGWAIALATALFLTLFCWAYSTLWGTLKLFEKIENEKKELEVENARLRQN